jgi:GTP-binding protein
MIPVVAIVGRPNVGKSTLFNRFIGYRKAIVDDRPGVTRDRNYGEGSFLGQKFIFVDTGGFEPEPDSDLFSEMRRQALIALEEADIFIFVVDRQTGMTPADELTVNILRRALPEEAQSKLVLAVNKCDGHRHDLEAVEFYSLGCGEPMTISAEHGRGMYEMWETILNLVPEEMRNTWADDDWEEESDSGELPSTEEEGEEDSEEGLTRPIEEIRVAILGRPNIGKSTLVNRMLGENRHVVCDMPGTTMDSIDSVVEINGQKFRFVDTAGIRRRAKIDERLESIAVGHAIRTIERCHVCILMIDGVEGVSKQDARLAALIADRGRACIILINKWDIVKDMPERNSAVVDDEIQTSLPHMSWAKVLYTSALTGKGCHRIESLILDAYKRFDTRISTSRLNRVFAQIVADNPPPQKHHHRVRLNYITQARVRPPTFVIWANSPEAVQDSYRRYIENRFRDEFDFEGSHLRIHLRLKRRQWEDLI